MQFTRLQLEIIEAGLKKGLNKQEILEKLLTQHATAKLAIIHQGEVFLRSVFKRSVMTVSSYDAKLSSVRKNTVTELAKTTFMKKSSKEIISRLSQDIFNTINNSGEASSAYREYAKKGIKHILSTKDYIEYKTPLTNFPVKMRINRFESTRVDYRIPFIKKKAMVCLVKDTKQIDKRKTTSSSVPSIIHSIDASIMLQTRNLFGGDMATIHDSFGTHLSDVNYLRSSINNSLADLYESDALHYIFSQMGYNEPTPKFGLTDDFYDEILSSEYAFN